MRQAMIFLCLAVASVSCAGTAMDSDGPGEWVGSVSTEGAITVVKNDAGSKWGGPATLVEEASIGVETGAPEYMLGSPGQLFATHDEIYVVDTQIPIVRVYDWNGVHLRDIGGVGQGPGEYQRPGAVRVDSNGRVYVSESGSSPRINVYSHEGESLETWRWGAGNMRMSAGTLVMRHDGALFTRAFLYPPGGPPVFENRITGMVQVGRDGAVGELVEMPRLDVERIEISVDGNDRGVSYSPTQVSAYSPAGAWIVGDNRSYSFEIHYPDGRIVRAHRFWDPVPIEDDHREYLARSTVANVRRFDDIPDWTWSGREIPAHKPAYYAFYPTQGNRVLVVREASSHRLEGCDVTFDLNTGPEEDCYPPDRVWDMFDLEGNYLGEVLRPDVGRLFSPFWRDDVLLLVVEDEWGTMKVKRFRFQLPGEAGAVDSGDEQSRP